MSADAQRFAGLHLAGFLREHGYEGALDPVHQMAIVPGADAVGPNNERLLLELARRFAVVLRPSPSSIRELHAQGDITFLGVRGQLDPSRGASAAKRLLSLSAIGIGLAVRRLQRRPMTWVRRATLLPRRSRDPVELALAASLRSLARQVEPEAVWQRLPPPR
jgi:hypothetical protein